MPLHNSLGAGDIHVVYQWSYVNAASRAAASGFVSADVGKVALQLDNNTLWLLTDPAPVWRSVGSLASDADHGNLSGGSLHAVATQSVAGFMSASDKIAVDTFTSGNVSIQVRNETGSPISKGTLVAPVGFSGAPHNRILVAAADKDNGALRPACGVLTANLADATNGAVLVSGELVDVNTAAWSLTDQLVLGSGGAFSRPPPDISPFTGEVQNVGQVSRVDATNGRILIAIDGMTPATADQLFALAGTNGTPSASNKYVTDSDPRVQTYGRTVTVAKTNADYTTIEDGLTAAAGLTPTAANPVVVLVFPGTYAENTPLTIPSNVSLVALSGSPYTVVTPSSPTDVICQGSADSRVQGFRFYGATGVGGVGYKHAAGTAYVLNCQSVDCETGFLFTGATTINTCLECAAIQATGAVQTGFKFESSAKASLATNRVLGLSGATITDGMVADNAEITGGVLEISYCDNGIRASNGALALFNSVLVEDCDQAVYVDNVGSGTDITLSSIVIRDSTTWDVICSSATAKLVLSGQIDTSSISLISGCDHSITGNSSEEDFPRYQIFGEAAVGRYEYPTRMGIGSGLPFFNGNKVYLNDNGEAGSWTDRTAEARSETGSTFTAFPGLGANNCIYFGADIAYAGVELNIVTVMVVGGGAVVSEYWNGAAWVTVHTMASLTTSPYTTYGETSMLRTGTEFMHGGYLPGWAKKTLNGSNKYWARYRITSPITTAPVLAWMRCIPHTQIVSDDGTPMRFGDSNVDRSLGWQRKLLDTLSGSAPSDENLTLSTNITLAATGNEFTNNAIDGRAGLVNLPEGVNTAKPISVAVTWYALANVGNVELELRYVTLPASSVLNGTATDTRLTNIVAVPGVAKTIVTSTFDIPVYSLVTEDLIGFSLYRDATAGNPDDTLAASIVIVDVHVHAYFWK